MSPSIKYLTSLFLRPVTICNCNQRRNLRLYIASLLINKERVSLKFRNGHYVRVVDNRERYQKRLSTIEGCKG